MQATLPHLSCKLVLNFQIHTETKTAGASEAEKKASAEKKKKEDSKVLHSFVLFQTLLLFFFDSRIRRVRIVMNLLHEMMQKAAIVKKAKHSVAGIYANLAKNLSDEPPKPEQFTLLQHRLAPVDR